MIVRFKDYSKRQTNMILVPTSDNPFYRWQVLVQMYAMRNLDITWIFYYNVRPSEHLKKMMTLGNIVAYPDWPRDRSYNASMKPWLIGKWLERNPGYVDDDILVIDPDVILIKPFDLEIKPNVLHGTDTDSYTGPDYLKSKAAWEAACRCVGVDPIKAAAYKGIGAQYAFTGINGNWWTETAKLSIQCYHDLRRTKSPDGHDVQAWCAEMYTTQLAAIRDGIEPRLEPSMSMVWARDKADGLDSAMFFHDAGVPKEEPGVFCKGSYQTGPWNKTINVDKSSASYRYVELIKDTEKAMSGYLS